MEGQFTRLEVCKLANITPSQLNYLDKEAIIVPKRIGGKRPTVLYTWSQVLTLKTYVKLRQQCSFQALRQSFEYLNELPEQLLADKRLVAYENEIFWIEDNESEVYNIITVSGKYKGQLICTFTFKELYEEIMFAGKTQISNFQERIENYKAA